MYISKIRDSSTIRKNMNVLFYNGPNFDTIDIELTRRQYILGNDYIYTNNIYYWNFHVL